MGVSKSANAKEIKKAYRKVRTRRKRPGVKGAERPSKLRTLLTQSRTPLTSSRTSRRTEQLSLQYHPDKNSDPGASEKFAEIARAYEVLYDEEKVRVHA